MGIVATNLLFDDDLIHKSIETNFDFEEYLDNQVYCKQKIDCYYEKPNVVFGVFMKAWSPMYELIIHLDSSENDILSLFRDNKRHVEEKFNRSRFMFLFSFEVKEVWQELKKISVDIIEKSIENKELINEISKIQGYHNNRITRKEHVIMEFMELYKAVYRAQHRNKGIIITYG